MREVVRRALNSRKLLNELSLTDKGKKLPGGGRKPILPEQGLGHQYYWFIIQGDREITRSVYLNYIEVTELSFP